MRITYIRTKENQVLDLTAMMILLVLCMSWGLQQEAIKVANRGISPLFQAGIRYVGATAFIWIWMAVRRETLMQRDGTLWWGIAAGLLFSAEFILIYWGLDYTHASRAFITYLAWFWLIRHYPPSRLASFTFLTPLFGVIAGGVLLNEPITGSLVLALVLVGMGIFLVNRPNAG